MSETPAAAPQTTEAPASVDDLLTANAASYFDSAGDDGGGEEAAEETPTISDVAEAYEAGDGEPEEDDGEGIEAAAEEGEEEAPQEEGPAPGSEEAPWTLTDLPDEHVTVKIDGEETTLSLRKAVEDGMRQATFDKRAHELKQIQQSTEQVAAEAQGKLAQLQQGTHAVLSNAERLLPYLEEHFPEVLDELSLAHYPRLLEADSAGQLEQFRQGRKLKQHERRLQQERQRVQSERQQAAQARATEARRSVVGPAMAAASVATKVRPTPEALSDIASALSARASSLGRDLTGPEVQGIAERFLRTYAENGEAPKPRKPRRAKKAVQGQRRSGTRAVGGAEPPRRAPDGTLNGDWLVWKQRQG